MVKVLESWIFGDDFSKENQYPAGGFKIWSQSGEYLPRGEVFYRWPLASLPEKGMLEIFSDEHACIELMHEGKHLYAGLGSIVFDLETLPPFYDVLVLRISSSLPHRALVWAQHYHGYEKVQQSKSSFKELEDVWTVADSKFFLNLTGDRDVWVKRNYHFEKSDKSWSLRFSQDIRELYLNGKRIPYPQEWMKVFSKEGTNEIVYRCSSWQPGAAARYYNIL